jgi:hypothetical protein
MIKNPLIKQPSRGPKFIDTKVVRKSQLTGVARKIVLKDGLWIPERVVLHIEMVNVTP